MTQNVTNTVAVTANEYVTVTQPVPVTQTIVVTATQTSTATVTPTVEAPETLTTTFTDSARPITMTTTVPAPPMVTTYQYLTTTETVVQQVPNVCPAPVTQVIQLPPSQQMAVTTVPVTYLQPGPTITQTAYIPQP
ncbi:hypothetical protein EV182_008724, partial [Spiromyces aspiralis]